MKKFFGNIKKYYRYAIRAAKAELKSEVSDSYLNWLWWIIEPLCFMLIYVFVFGYIFKHNEPYYASFIYIGLTVWQFFNRMITGSVRLIAGNRDLVTKVYIPKYILLLSKSFTFLFKFGISFLIVFVLMLIQGVTITWHILLIIPVLIVLYILSFGIGMILMNYGVKFSDLLNFTHIGLRMLFYVSGVFYNLRTKIGGAIGFFLLRLNPAAFLMDEARKCMLEGKMVSIEGLLFWLIIGIILCMIGVRIIHKNENTYAKVI
ncbi:MAG: ABC transporter permease [Bacilli bacterium]|nr:ABC transporter permease [Bacilli bacterium]